MKRKFLLPILSVCMVVALVSVGFAAWLITGNSTTAAEGQFTTYTVKNNAFELKAEIVDNKKVVFGKPSSTDGVENPWFKFEEDVANEQLTVQLKLTLTPDDKTTDGVLNNILNAGYKVTVTLSEQLHGESEPEVNNTYDTAVTAKYVQVPTFKEGDLNIAATGAKLASGLSFDLEVKSGNFTAAEDSKSATATIEITFHWGTWKDEGTEQNPYSYFNTLTNNVTNRSAAQSAMNAIYALNNVKYDVKLAIN